MVLKGLRITMAVIQKVRYINLDIPMSVTLSLQVVVVVRDPRALLATHFRSHSLPSPRHLQLQVTITAQFNPQNSCGILYLPFLLSNLLIRGTPCGLQD